MSESGRATDHLANERTFLAWIRSALALLGLGFVVAKFGFWLRQIALLESHHSASGSGGSLVIGLGLLAFGALTAGVGLLRYRTARHALEAGTFVPAGRTVDLTAAAVIALTVLLMGYLLLNHRTV